MLMVWLTVRLVDCELEDEIELIWHGGSYQFHAREYGSYGIEIGLFDFIRGGSYDLLVAKRRDVAKIGRMARERSILGWRG